MLDNKSIFISYISESIAKDTFIKFSFSNYKGNVENLKKILGKLIILKNKRAFNFTFRYATKDIVKNYSIEESYKLMNEYLDVYAFRSATVFTSLANHQLDFSKKGKSILRNFEPTNESIPNRDHDKQKKRKIPTINKPYLQELGLLSKTGEIFNSAQNKYKQINHYIELLSPLLTVLPKRPLTKVVDMGSGKGYLSFALYDYLNNEVNINAELIGVEYRSDLVDLCNNIAKNAQFNQLRFEQGTIEKFSTDEIHVLIALHACDTATDEAIFKGIQSNADLIVVAPCCHKQIRREISKAKAKNNLNYLTRYGIFLERQAEMVTDGLRALILEYHGYKTKVFEFVSEANTPKNVLIVGSKQMDLSMGKKRDILNEIHQSKAYFGIEKHHLELLLNLS